jgi:ubiquinone/menaquinone biosynthesis C-methylase UbiE
MDNKNILSNVSNYYTEKINHFGATPQGVDWNSAESQQLRFKKLLSIIDDPASSFSLLDYGCGFGSMYEFMKPGYPQMKYTGIDIAEPMISNAWQRFGNDNTQWYTSLPADFKSDYVIASGIFNVKLNHSNEEWLAYVKQILTEMDRIAQKGFAFNMLTSYSDLPYMKEYLYYANPGDIFDYCIRTFSRKVDLLHGYQLFEFSTIVRKNTANPYG